MQSYGTSARLERVCILLPS